jgi:hypothetical protein
MSETSPYKFLILQSAGSKHASVEDYFYNWSVIHTSLFLGSPCVLNFSRYAQNYLNPDVPNETRLIKRHPEVRYHSFADHWSETWVNVEGSILDPSHKNRLRRHAFGDPTTLKMLFGRSEVVYRHPDFKHPATTTIGHFLAIKPKLSRKEFFSALSTHEKLILSKLEEFGRPVKYTVDVYDDEIQSHLLNSPIKKFPAYDYICAELFHFGDKKDAFLFTELYGVELRSSYSDFIDLDKSHSVYGVERMILDYTDDSKLKMLYIDQ